MEYKDIFERIKGFILDVPGTWSQIVTEKRGGGEIINLFILPLIGFATLATFIGTLFYNPGYNFQVAIVKSIVVFISAFGGVYTSVSIIHKGSASKYFNMPIQKNISTVLVAYSFTPYLVIQIVSSLIPELFFLKILGLYSAYIFWEGLSHYFEISEDRKLQLVSAATAVILICPYIFERILKMILPGININ